MVSLTLSLLFFVRKEYEQEREQERRVCCVSERDIPGRTD